jgi:hypothetical protein
MLGLLRRHNRIEARRGGLPDDALRAHLLNVDDSLRAHDRLAIEHAKNTYSGAPEPPSARDVFAQLRALSREYGGVVYNHARGTIAVVTPRVVLADRSHPAVVVDFGPFELRLALHCLADHRPATEAFTAVALERQYSKSGNDDISHPNVNAAGICFGHAADPVAKALRDGRILDAFSIAATLLAAEGARNNPYTFVWQFAYTQNELYDEGIVARPPPRSAAAPDDEDDEGNEDDEDDDTTPPRAPTARRATTPGTRAGSATTATATSATTATTRATAPTATAAPATAARPAATAATRPPASAACRNVTGPAAPTSSAATACPPASAARSGPATTT